MTQRPAVTSIKISQVASDKIGEFGEKKRIVEELADWLPVYDFCKKNELSIDEALKRLSIAPRDENVQRFGKNRDKFNELLDKLMRHNVRMSHNGTSDDMICITQRLMLNVIGGNANTIADECRLNAVKIAEHNKRFNLDDMVNRRLSYRIREEYGTVADWIRKVVLV